MIVSIATTKAKQSNGASTNGALVNGKATNGKLVTDKPVNGKKSNGASSSNDHSCNGHSKLPTVTNPYQITVSRRLLIFSMVYSIVAAFLVSRGARSLLMRSQQRSKGTWMNSMKQVSDNKKEPEPYRQHMVVDMEGLSEEFLSSESKLALALVEMAQQDPFQVSRLSYHCHKRSNGVSCAAFLFKAHVTLHTFADRRLLYMDISSSQEGAHLVDALPTVKAKFGISTLEKEPKVVWSLKKRGSRPPSILEVLESAWPFKEQIVSTETTFQTIDIYEAIDGTSRSMSHYEKSLLAEDSYNSRNPELFVPNRLVYLNSVLQSTRHGDAAYHEALVHPAMFAHPNPRRVAIIGGGEGATLREVLKHSTLQDAIMIEIDKEMIETSRTHLSEWNSCKDLEGSTDCCFDDPRAQVYTEDALAWFIDRFYQTDEQGANEKGLPNAEPMDVIIMDALDPSDQVEFCDVLYNNSVFLQSIHKALSDDGVLVMQLGEAPAGNDPPDTHTKHHNRAVITKELEVLGFESVHVYEESHCEFGAPWAYLVAFKKYETRADWYANEAEIELDIHNRTLRTKSGQSPFRYFDGATMMSYQTPHKVYSEVFCRQEPMPASCEESSISFERNRPNIQVSSFEVKASLAGENAGRGLFAKVDIPTGAYIAIEKGVEAVSFPPSTFELISDFNEYKVDFAPNVLEYYMHGYGFESDSRGKAEITVDSTIMTFSNHGCNGTYNIGWPTDGPPQTEWTVNLSTIPQEEEEESLYNPVRDRNLRRWETGGDVSLRTIRAGEELFCDYLLMTSTEDDWEQDVIDLQEQCSGQGIGDVSEYEEQHRD